MLRAALLSLAVAAAALPVAFTLASAHDPAGDPSPLTQVQWSQLGVDDSLLPGSTGWFVVPVTVDQPAYVRFASDIYTGSSPAAQSAWATLLVLEQEEASGLPPILGTGTSDARGLAAVSHEGETLACCAEMWSSYSWSWGDGPEVVIPMQPGQVAWFGFAAAGWGEWDDAYLEVSGQALITLGEPRTGERVEAVDLYQEALDQGTRAQLFGQDLVGLPGDASREWTAEGFGVLVAEAWSWGSTATFSIDLPGESREIELTTDSGAYATAHRAGTFRVALSDIERGIENGAWPLAPGDGLWARALFIDLDVPGDAAYIYTWPEA